VIRKILPIRRHAAVQGGEKAHILRFLASFSVTITGNPARIADN